MSTTRRTDHFAASQRTARTAAVRKAARLGWGEGVVSRFGHPRTGVSEPTVLTFNVTRPGDSGPCGWIHVQLDRHESEAGARVVSVRYACAV